MYYTQLQNQKLLAGTVSVLLAWQQIITQALVWSMDPAMAAFLANQDLWHNLGSDRGELKKEEEGTLLRRTEQEAVLCQASI